MEMELTWFCLQVAYCHRSLHLLDGSQFTALRSYDAGRQCTSMPRDLEAGLTVCCTVPSMSQAWFMYVLMDSPSSPMTWVLLFSIDRGGN